MGDLVLTEADFAAKAAKIQANPRWEAPMGFGVFRRVGDGVYEEKNWETVVTNWNGENARSAAMLLHALGHDDRVADTLEFLMNEIPADSVKRMVGLFQPYWEAAKGHSHLNVQAVKAMNTALAEDRLDEFAIVFVWPRAVRQSGSFLCEMLKRAHMQMAQ